MAIIEEVLHQRVWMNQLLKSQLVMTWNRMKQLSDKKKKGIRGDSRLETWCFLNYSCTDKQTLLCVEVLGWIQDIMGATKYYKRWGL